MLTLIDQSGANLAESAAAPPPAPLSAKAIARRAVRDAKRAMVLDMPTPAEFAARMPPRLAAMLATAWLRNNNEWVVAREIAPDLRSWGLVGIGTDGLTAFGIAVRKVLLRGDQG